MTDNVNDIPALDTSNENNPAAPMMAASKEQLLLDALRNVVDPEIGLDVVALGLIRDMELAEDHTHITMIMTTPFCPYAPQLLEQTRRTAQEATGVPTTIEMGLEQWGPELMEDGAGEDWGLFY